MPRIFISYRRADSRKDAGRIFDRVAQAFGKENVFMDLTIPPGKHFVAVIERTIIESNIMLVIIGKSWLTIADSVGRRRLDDPEDYVRMEIEMGLRHNLEVIPVVICGAEMPPKGALPEDMRQLAFRNAVFIRCDTDEIFDADVAERLIAPLLPPEMPSASINVHEAIAQFYAQFEAGDWDGARASLSAIRASGKVPRVFNPDTLEREVWAAIEAKERAEEYSALRLMLDGGSSESVWAALRLFWEKYPGFDPDGIAEKVHAKPRILEIMPEPFAWIDIPAGSVTNGVALSPYRISKYPVTNRQYQVFIDAADGYQKSRWWDFSSEAEQWRHQQSTPKDPAFSGDDHPRVNISWFEAVAFTRWLSAQTGERIRLPSENEWRRAAQGDQGQAYPWGDAWDGSRCNNSVEPLASKGTTPVKQYEPRGSSPFGVVDLAGNVWEWTLDESSSKIDLTGKRERLLYGGSWFDNSESVFRANFRVKMTPERRMIYVGFRLVCL